MNKNNQTEIDEALEGFLAAHAPERARETVVYYSPSHINGIIIR